MADSQDRVHGWHHKIKRDEVRAGDHIYTHNVGGDKHGIVYKNENEDMNVAYYDKNLARITSLENFADGNCIRLHVYGVSNNWKWLTRRGSCSIRKCTSPEEVVQNVLYYLEHQDEIQLQTHQNPSESFATACTSRTSLVVENPEFPEIDDSSLRANCFSHKIQPDNLKPGDHIYAYRKLGTYAHHGIYIGKNESGIHIVIHFTGDPGTKKAKATAKIRRARLDEFLEGAELRLVTYCKDSVEECGISHALESLPASQVVQTAEYYAKRPDRWENYDFALNNCEHFCIFCKTEEKVDRHSDIQDQTKSFWMFFPVLLYTLKESTVSPTR